MRYSSVREIIGVLLFCIVSLVFLYTPMKYGLFFDKHIYFWEIIINVSFIITIIIFFKNTNWKVFVIFLIPVFFAISTIGAESPFHSLEETLRWTSYASFFAVTFICLIHKPLKPILSLVLYLTASYLAIFGFFNLWGFINFQDAILNGRMSGPLQYPNTFGLLMAVGWIFGLILVSQNKLPKRHLYIYASMLTVLLSGLLLSYSRGVFILVPIVWLLGLILINVKEQVRYILFTLVSSLFSLVIVYLSDSSHSSNTIVSIILLIVSLIILFSMVRFPLEGYLKIFNKLKNKWILPVGLFIITIFLVADLLFEGLIYSVLPESLQNKISSISLSTSSVVGRMIFYKQAWAMSQEAPIFGFGGDGWRVLFTKFQEVPYWARETHNFYLELLLNIGWFGTLVTLGVIITLIVLILMGIKNNGDEKGFGTAVLPALAIMLMHGMLDFDFSFGTTILFLTWLLALGISTNDSKVFSKTWRYLVNIIILVGVSVATLFSYQLISAQSIVDNDGQKRVTLSEAEKNFQKAIDKNPYNISYYVNLAQVYSQSYQNDKQEKVKAAAVRLIEKAYKLEPNNPDLLYDIGKIFSKLQEPYKAIEFYKKALEQDRFNTKYSSAFIKENVLFGEYLIKQKSIEKGQNLLSNAVTQYEESKHFQKEFEEEKFPDKRNLQLNKDAYLLTGEAYLLLGEYKKALELISSTNFEKGESKWSRAKAVEYLSYVKLSMEKEAKEVRRVLQEQGNEKYIDRIMTLLPKF